RLQLIGVYDKKWLRPMAETLHRLGTRRAWLVHGADGMDEISTTGPTHVVKLHENGFIEESVLTPGDFGLAPARPEDLRGSDAPGNAAALEALLKGARSAYRDIVLANAAAVLCVHGSASALTEGMEKAARAIDGGDALSVLEDYRAFSQEGAA